MRPRGSFTGPIVIIAVGFVFLIHAISPDLPLLDWLAQYWPYLLIGWGTIALIEVAIRTFRGGPIPTNGVSGGGWFFVVILCLLGMGLSQFRGSEGWWNHTEWGRGFDDTFGEEHEFPVNGMQRAVGATPRVVLDGMRGDVKITGVDGRNLTLSGEKTIRAFKDQQANQSNAQTPVDVTVSGSTVTIHCNQNRAAYRTSVKTDLDISLPKGASLEVNGNTGDLDVSQLSGDVTLRGGNSGVHLQDIGGNVNLETRRSDLIRCTNVKGTINLRGRGSDVELTRVEGQVTVDGDFTGTVSLRSLSKPVRVENSRTDLQVAQIQGEVRLDRGSLSIQGATGPVRVNAHSTDVSLEGTTDALDISVDRGDIDLKPQHLPLGAMAVHSGSGNIELALPQAAKFTLTATTDHGDIENDYGDGLQEQTSGQGAKLEGTVGAGPNLNLMTGRGTIKVRKSSEETVSASVASLATGREGLQK